MYTCDRCQKGLQVGMAVSHSHRRTKKRSLPNLHLTSVFIGGKKVRGRFCTKCLRIVRTAYPYQVEKKESVVKEVQAKVEEKKVVEKTDKTAALEKQEVEAVTA